MLKSANKVNHWCLANKRIVHKLLESTNYLQLEHKLIYKPDWILSPACWTSLKGITWKAINFAIALKKRWISGRLELSGAAASGSSQHPVLSPTNTDSKAQVELLSWQVNQMHIKQNQTCKYQLRNMYENNIVSRFFYKDVIGTPLHTQFRV
jgi:hypothetical protein